MLQNLKINHDDRNKRSLMLYYYDIRKYFCCVKGIQYELLFTTSICYYFVTTKKDIKSQSFYAITENQLLLIASKISILSQVYLFSILSVRHVVIIILTHDLFLLTNR